MARLLTSDMLTVTLTCGMYDYSGEWAYSVGIPAKNGVGDGILGILPGAGGMAVFSPRLDEHGNSVHGLRVFEELSREFEMRLFRPRSTLTITTTSSTRPTTRSVEIGAGGQPTEVDAHEPPRLARKAAAQPGTTTCSAR